MSLHPKEWAFSDYEDGTYGDTPEEGRDVVERLHRTYDAQVDTDPQHPRTLLLPAIALDRFLDGRALMADAYVLTEVAAPLALGQIRLPEEGSIERLALCALARGALNLRNERYLEITADMGPVNEVTMGTIKGWKEELPEEGWARLNMLAEMVEIEDIRPSAFRGEVIWGYRAKGPPREVFEIGDPDDAVAMASIDGEHIPITRQVMRDTIKRGAPAPQPWPRWQASPSFAKVAQGIDEGVVTEWVTEDQLSPAGLFYIHALKQLRLAHPIAVSPSQVLALEGVMLDVAAATEYLRKANLPFQSLYLDFTGPDGGDVSLPIYLPGSTSDKGEDDFLVHWLAGAQVWADEDGQGLKVLPWSRTWLFDNRRGVIDDSQSAYEVDGEVIVDRRPNGEDDETQRWFMNDDMDRASVSSRQARGACAYPAGYFLRGKAPRPRWLPEDPLTPVHAAVLPATPGQAVREPDPAPHRDRLIEEVMCVRTLDSYCVAATVLHFMQAANVHIVEAPLIKRERKRADKRGWPTASAIRVKRTVRRSGGSSPAANGDGQPTRRWSVQTDVAGFYRHVRRGSHVRCIECRGEGSRVEKVGEAFTQVTCERCGGCGLDPDLVTPCVQRDDDTGELTCPGGCRREWVPPHIRGPEDAPYVPKVRKL